MTTQTEIPDDIRKLANRLASVIIINSGGVESDKNKAEAMQAIASALLAERNRTIEECAGIAEGWEVPPLSHQWTMRKSIAAAIRALLK